MDDIEIKVPDDSPKTASKTIKSTKTLFRAQSMKVLLPLVNQEAVGASTPTYSFKKRPNQSRETQHLNMYEGDIINLGKKAERRKLRKKSNKLKTGEQDYIETLLEDTKQMMR